MEIFFILWGLVGFVSALILNYLDYKDGVDITTIHLVATLLSPLMGGILLLLILVQDPPIVIFKGKKK